MNHHNAMQDDNKNKKELLEIFEKGRWIKVNESTYLHAIHNGMEGRINGGELINHWQKPESFAVVPEETQEELWFDAFTEAPVRLHPKTEEFLKKHFTIQRKVKK
jgi:hypothetical protein